MPEKSQMKVVWKRGTLFPLRQIFSRLVFGNLEEGLINAAKTGNSPAVQKWIDRGANMHVAGARALRVAALNHHVNTVALLLYYGIDADNLPPGSLPSSAYSLSPPPGHH